MIDTAVKCEFCGSTDRVDTFTQTVHTLSTTDPVSMSLEYHGMQQWQLCVKCRNERGAKALGLIV